MRKILDSINPLKLKKDIEQLAQENAKLLAMLSPEQQKSEALKKRIDELTHELSESEKKLDNLRYEVAVEDRKLHDLKKQLVVVDEDVMMESFALYKPMYSFMYADEYRAKIEKVRGSQKDLIKTGKACLGKDWTVNGSASQGKKMVKDMQKLLLRAFNSECEEIVDRIKYNNFETSLKRINASYEQIAKLGSIMGVAIAREYYNSKIDELRLALEYRQKKQEEKEAQKVLKDQQREEEKLRKEIDEQRRKIEKEQNHYINALKKIDAQLENTTEDKKVELLAKRSEIENFIAEAEKALKDIDYREANQRAGYIYVVSNIGAFGENIYKIGMTRRLDPMERVDELGNASVPFNFDVHAMIFSDDAPKLEATLHKTFDDKKLNWVNTRREFFNVTLGEIKAVIMANYDKTAEFIEVADAEQYRISGKMREQR